MSRCTASDICIKCGVCCDGTAFGQIVLEDTDLSEVSLEMNLMEAEGKRILQQPCPAHINNTCTIYSHRPSICGDYQCKLLKEYENEEVSESDAHEAIDTLKSVKSEIEAYLMAAGVKNGQGADDIHTKMWALERDALVTMTTQQFNNLHRPLLLKYQVLKELLTDKFGIEFKGANTFV